MGSTLIDNRNVVDVIYVVQAWNVRECQFVEVVKFDNKEAAQLVAERITEVNGVATKIDQWVTTSTLVKLIKPKGKQCRDF